MKKIFIIAFITLGLGSCTKYLDVKTYGKAVPETSEEFSALLHTHLNEIDYGGNHALLENVGALLDIEVITDNFSLPLTLSGGRNLPKYIGSSLNGKQRRYENLYEVIRDANIIINNMKSVTGQKDRNVLGTAHSLRAVAYYYLLREYCEPYTTDDKQGLPIVRDFDMEERPARSSYGQTVAFIADEFEKALTYGVKDEIYRYTADVTKAYQARFYFWIRDWEKASVLAKDIVDKYPLVKGKEYIDMIQSKHTKLKNVLLKSYLYAGANDQENIKEQEASTQRPLSKSFADLFVEKEKDVRYELSFDKKRINNKVFNGKVRSAEFQLILAESYAHLGKEDLALQAINKLRAHRIEDNVDLTTATLPAVDAKSLITVDAEGKPVSKLINLILNERRKELYAEGDRFFELKRNGRPEFWSADNGLKYTTYKYMYTFPLPRVDMEVVSGLVQNEGYKL
ncbi:RagB/SusD family nutrient uptake outer membrane protein [Sphingobacterium yanglingense]|uniref:SusD-like starch-binding protein associating with outer membrane n=1 Tax=Sphingobacterium yanglingense TaxID=1437280 RepID=A0A4R6WKN3_9SPHI|nr:RagB/SusD family nutrient uptake outer membrane protein [Sphingobacterium yanglingense]TDQ79497.1 SusD-like starch-binding protein associating with outer membrane [Sphingobacterium yanglingense]